MEQWTAVMRTTPDNEWPSLLHFPTPQTHKQIQTAHFQSPTTRAWTIDSGQWSELECWRQVTRYLQCVIITINYLIWVQAVSRSRMSQSQVWYELWPGCLVTSGQHTPDTVPVSGPTTGLGTNNRWTQLPVAINIVHVKSFIITGHNLN